MDTGQQHYLKLPAVRTARWHGPLLVLAAAMGFVVLWSLVGLVVDHRTVTALPVWDKPLKFGLSIAIYALTTAYLIPLLPKAKRTMWWLGTGIAVTMIGEMAIVGLQAFRGTTSHFNTSTPFDGLLWMTMGIAITVMWFANLGIAFVAARARIGDRVLSRALRWGLFTAAVGMAIGYVMARQDTSDLEGVAGAHTVGRADGGPGLPFLGWSTVAGDLRPAHFIGMHAVQLLPLLAMGLAWLGARRANRLADEGVRGRVVLTAAVAYTAFVGLVFWQAVRGESIVQPGGLTLAGLAVIAAGTAAGLVAAFRTRRTSAGTPSLPRAVAAQSQ